jgi:hypothetical protein
MDNVQTHNICKNKSQFAWKESVHYSIQEARILGTILNKFVKTAPSHFISLRITTYFDYNISPTVCVHLFRALNLQQKMLLVNLTKTDNWGNIRI